MFLIKMILFFLLLYLINVYKLILICYSVIEGVRWFLFSFFYFRIYKEKGLNLLLKYYYVICYKLI